MCECVWEWVRAVLQRSVQIALFSGSKAVPEEEGNKGGTRKLEGIIEANTDCFYVKAKLCLQSNHMLYTSYSDCLLWCKHIYI